MGGREKREFGFLHLIGTPRDFFFHLIGPPPTPVSMLFERLLDFFPRRHRVCQSPTLIRRGGGRNASESEGRGSNASYSRFSLPGMDSLWGSNNSQFLHSYASRTVPVQCPYSARTVPVQCPRQCPLAKTTVFEIHDQK